MHACMHAVASPDRCQECSRLRHHSCVQRFRAGTCHCGPVHPDRDIQASAGRWRGCSLPLCGLERPMWVSIFASPWAALQYSTSPPLPECAATCILFGDGCGAVIVTATDGPCGLLGLDMHSDGNGQKSLNCLFAGEVSSMVRFPVVPVRVA